MEPFSCSGSVHYRQHCMLRSYIRCRKPTTSSSFATAAASEHTLAAAKKNRIAAPIEEAVPPSNRRHSRSDCYRPCAALSQATCQLAAAPLPAALQHATPSCANSPYGCFPSLHLRLIYHFFLNTRRLNLSTASFSARPAAAPCSTCCTSAHPCPSCAALFTFSPAQMSSVPVVPMPQIVSCALWWS